MSSAPQDWNLTEFVLFVTNNVSQAMIPFCEALQSHGVSTVGELLREDWDLLLSGTLCEEENILALVREILCGGRRIASFLFFP